MCMKRTGLFALILCIALTLPGCAARSGGKDSPALPQPQNTTAAQAGVRLTRLTDYGVMELGREHERVVLLGFAGMDEAAIEAGLEALRRAWM